MYFLNWAMTTIVDSTAIATYVKFWSAFNAFLQWLIALVALALVFGMNMVSVALFGEFEFWAALIKVAALFAFLVAGTIFLAGRYKIDGHSTGLSVVANNGGFFPVGLLPLVVVTSGVVFAYAVVELVGTAAGRPRNRRRSCRGPSTPSSPASRCSTSVRCSCSPCCCPTPPTSAAESPFVTFFGKIGIQGAGSMMNFVVLTAAFSSLNAGLYSTGRILRSMSMNGSAPKFTGLMSGRGVPYGGICLTASIGLLGVLLNGVVPEKAFEIVLNVASLGILSSWATIVICQIQLYRWSQQGRMERPSFRMWGSPYTGYLTLVFLVGVLVLMAFNYPIGTWTVVSLVVIVPALICGWFWCAGEWPPSLPSGSATPDRSP